MQDGGKRWYLDMDGIRVESPALVGLTVFSRVADVRAPNGANRRNDAPSRGPALEHGSARGKA
jgi:hypothetical protein